MANNINRVVVDRVFNSCPSYVTESSLIKRVKKIAVGIFNFFAALFCRISIRQKPLNGIVLTGQKRGQEKAQNQAIKKPEYEVKYFLPEEQYFQPALQELAKECVKTLMIEEPDYRHTFVISPARFDYFNQRANELLQEYGVKEPSDLEKGKKLFDQLLDQAIDDFLESPRDDRPSLQ